MALQFGQQQQQARLYGPRQKNLSGLDLKTLAYPQAAQKALQKAASRLVPTPLQSRAQPYRQAATEQLRRFEASPPQFTMPMFPNPQVSDSYGDPALIGSPGTLGRFAANPDLASFAERYRQPSAIEQRARYMG